MLPHQIEALLAGGHQPLAPNLPVPFVPGNLPEAGHGQPSTDIVYVGESAQFGPQYLNPGQVFSRAAHPGHNPEDGPTRALRLAGQRLELRQIPPTDPEEIARWKAFTDPEAVKFRVQSDALLRATQTAIADVLTTNTDGLPSLRKIQQDALGNAPLAPAGVEGAAVQVPPESALAEPGGEFFAESGAVTAPIAEAASASVHAETKTTSAIGMVSMDNVHALGAQAEAPGPVIGRPLVGEGKTIKVQFQSAAQEVAPEAAAEVVTTAESQFIPALDIEGLFLAGASGGDVYIDGYRLAEFAEFMAVRPEGRALLIALKSYFDLSPEREAERAGIIAFITSSTNSLRTTIAEITANPDAHRLMPAIGDGNENNDAEASAAADANGRYNLTDAGGLRLLSGLYQF